VGGRPHLQSGNDLIVEYIVETEAWMRRLIDLLEGCDVFFVGIHCRLDELERRERARGDRRIGDARHDFQKVHGHCVYDAELDATSLPAEVNADRVLALWRRRQRPSAFERLASATP
jgi:chloramphenicol 3-O phosphotransferase